GLAGAGVAATDTDFLAGRRCYDLEPRGPRELDHRVGIRIVHPALTAIERHVEGRAIREAAATYPIRSLNHDDLATRHLDTPRCGNAGRARADHDNVGLARRYGCECRPTKHRSRRECRGRLEEAAPRHCHVMVSECF